MSNIKHSLPCGFVLQGPVHTYRIERVLGQGSFGITYLATTKVTIGGALGSLETTINVALKEFFMAEVNSRDNHTVTSGNQDGLFDNYKRKFAKEAKNLSELNHPHIIKVLESFEANNTVYYSMEFCENGNLDDIIERNNGIQEQSALDFFKQVAEALMFMHNRQLLHLDLKPSNIMLRNPREVIIIDFGLSKHYDQHENPESSTTIGGGTPGYSPIEQANYKSGDKLAVTLDVYALGATLYKMLVGKRPPVATDIFNDGFPTEELQKKGVSVGIIACIKKSMSSAKKERYQTVNEFIEAINAATPKEKPKQTTFVAPESDETTFDNAKADETSFDSSNKTEHTQDTQTVEVSDTNTTETQPITDKKGFNLKLFLICAVATIAIVIIHTLPSVIHFYGNLCRDIAPQFAEQCYTGAAHKGYIRSMMTLYRIYLHGHNTKADKPKALYWITQAAAIDNTGRCEYIIAEEYRKGHFTLTPNGDAITNKDAEAAKWYQTAAEKNLDIAQYELGKLYYNGKGVKQNNTEALKWLEQAAKKGNEDAVALIEKIKEQNTPAVAQLQQTQKPQQTTKPANSNQQATANIEPTAVNKPTAPAVIYRQPQTEVDRESQPKRYSTSELRQNGEQELKNGNHEEAIKWYLMAADRNSIVAIIKLANIYQDIGNDYESRKWHLKAAEKGEANMQNNLAKMYEEGEGGPVNYAEAIKWYTKAAEQGNAAGQYNLGRVYDDGVGCPTNKSEAIKWYRKAAEQGHTKAKQRLAELLNN